MGEHEVRLTDGRRRSGGSGRRPLEQGMHRPYVHAAWTTLGRMPLLGRRSRRAVELHLVDLCRRLGTELAGVRVRRDRVHLVIRIRSSQDAGRMVTRLKRGSEERLILEGVPAVWGGGYAATRVGPKRLSRLLARMERPECWSRRGAPSPEGVPRG